MRIFAAILEEQRHRLFLWMPVCFASGIGIYFALPLEPDVFVVIGIAAVSLLILAGRRHDHILRNSVLATLTLIGLGYSYSALRTQMAAEPVLSRHYYGAVEGRIIGLDRSASNAPRILLDQIYLPGMSPINTPARVRVSLHGLIPDDVLRPGQRVTFTSRISPPSPPVEPGGFDFRRMAWFMKIGGVGYTRNPILPAAGSDTGGFRMLVFTLRIKIADGLRQQIDGQKGAFAAAILTGDRSAIDPEVMATLRASNLAHLLAISGLHMGLLSGFVFVIVRFGLALIPFLAVRIQTKKLAAICALLAGLAYLLLSGASVATQRAFIMTAVVLLAVLIDRPALSLRAVALAAMLVLIIKPFSLLEAGFQMSFAATTALIAVYQWLHKSGFLQQRNGLFWRVFKPVFTLVLTSAVAGAATAPISAFHFNQISQYGLLANLLAVPFMGMLVMPSAVIAGMLSLFGAQAPALFIMGEGIGLILAIADFVSNLNGSINPVKSGPAYVLVMIALGGLMFALWLGKGKILGFMAFLIAIAQWQQYPRPILLISDDARLFGVLGQQGRVLNKDRGGGYAASIWLENDGDLSTQQMAYLRDGMRFEEKLVFAGLPEGWNIISYTGDDAALVSRYCQANMIILLAKLEYADGSCMVISAKSLAQTGSLAIDFDGGDLNINRSRTFAQGRPWGY